MNEPMEKFVSVVRDYCDWASSKPKAEKEEVRVAIRLLADLYSKVLRLPKPDPGEDLDRKRVSDEDWKKVYGRFGSLPFQFYLDCFRPAQMVEEEPGTGDLADDLADICRDLKEGLGLYDEGRIAEAFWEWRQSFITHWGRHASSALHALHAYAVDEGIEL